jgi:hypothetical protein
MRRKKQQLSQEEAIAILERGTSGVLSLCGTDHLPYGVPLNYIYHEGALYFHCAQTGQKLDLITQNGNASFCVIGEDTIVPEEYTSYFRSVIATGTIEIVTDPSEKIAALEWMAKKYHPTGTDDHRDRVIQKELSAVCILAMKIEQLTGKEALELTQLRTTSR